MKRHCDHWWGWCAGHPHHCEHDLFHTGRCDCTHCESFRTPAQVFQDTMTEAFIAAHL
jgi:hypothetical protein